MAPTFRNDTLPCLVEISSLKIEEDDPKFNDYTEKQFILFVSFINNVVNVTLGKDLSSEHKLVTENQRPHFEVFCLQMGLMLSEFLKNQISKIEILVVENPNEFTENIAIALGRALDYLIQLSNIPNDELFRVMMEFWHEFTYYIMVSSKGKDLFSKTGDISLINLQQKTVILNYSTIRRDLFPKVLKRI